MLPTPASRAGGRSGPASRFVLAGLLAALLIASMLAMHSIPANAMAMHDAGTHPVATAHPGAAHPGATHLGAHEQAAAVPLEPEPAGMACASCPPDHLMAAGCMASTHLIFPSLFPPALLAGGRAAPVRAGPGTPASLAILPRAPSIHFLCISRT